MPNTLLVILLWLNMIPSLSHLNVMVQYSPLSATHFSSFNILFLTDIHIFNLSSCYIHLLDELANCMNMLQTKQVRHLCGEDHARVCSFTEKNLFVWGWIQSLLLSDSRWFLSNEFSSRKGHKTEKLRVKCGIWNCLKILWLAFIGFQGAAEKCLECHLPLTFSEDIANWLHGFCNEHLFFPLSLVPKRVPSVVLWRLLNFRRIIRICASVTLYWYVEKFGMGQWILLWVIQKFSCETLVGSGSK